VRWTGERASFCGPRLRGRRTQRARVRVWKKKKASVAEAPSLDPPADRIVLDAPERRVGDADDARAVANDGSITRSRCGHAVRAKPRPFVRVVVYSSSFGTDRQRAHRGFASRWLKPRRKRRRWSIRVSGAARDTTDHWSIRSRALFEVKVRTMVTPFPETCRRPAAARRGCERQIARWRHACSLGPSAAIFFERKPKREGGGFARDRLRFK